MKYMLMMHAPKGKGDWEIFNWPPQDIKAHMDFLNRLNEELRDAGELVGIEGLTEPRKARLVRAGNDGRPVTDGVFPETKEFLAGYWIIDVDRPERAYEVAGKASAAPGPGGKPLNMDIEVREVMSGCHVEA